MTPSEAREISKGRLVFGNLKHMEAEVIMGEVGRAVTAMLRCHHNYELRTKFCSCLVQYSSVILTVAAENRRVGPQWLASIKKCTKDRP